jgi:glycosyltransferase involved in cell wall biosynthesis
MNESALVSVVIPVFNRESLIATALQSALNQTHRPLEIIVVDDGSEDGTVAACREWMKRNARDGVLFKLLEQSHGGANVARNRGIAESSGSYIALLDSDDTWLPEKISKQIPLFEKNEKIGGVYCGLKIVDLSNGEVVPLEDRDYPAGDILKEMLVRDVTNPTSCWIVKKNVFVKVGDFDPTLEAREDWDMWIRICVNYEIACLPEVLVEMGKHSGERVSSDHNHGINARKAIFRKYAYLRKRFPFWLSLAARANMYRQRGRAFLRWKGARLKAAGYQMMAILVWPFEFDSYAALLGVCLPSDFRDRLTVFWNRIFGKTWFEIRSN